MRPVLMAGNRRRRRSSRARTETQLPQADGRADPQPRAAAVGAAAGGGDRMGDGADRDRASRRPALSAALRGARRRCSTRSRRRLRRSGWGAALVRYELLLLAELGFGLDLDRCAVTGANDDLVAVSPKSGRAVSAAEAEPYAGKLLPLPPLRSRGRRGVVAGDRAGARAHRPFPDARVLTDRSQPIAEARSRLVDRLRRAGGLA